MTRAEMERKRAKANKHFSSSYCRIYRTATPFIFLLSFSRLYAEPRLVDVDVGSQQRSQRQHEGRS